MSRLLSAPPASWRAAVGARGSSSGSSGGRPARARPCVAAAAAHTAEEGVADVLESLREAFALSTPPQQPAQRRQPASAASAREQPQEAQPAAAAAAAPAAPAAKKRRGRFVELMQSLEHEAQQQQGGHASAQPSSSSSSTASSSGVSSSRGSSSGSGTSNGHQQLQPAAPGTTAAAAPSQQPARRAVRRISSQQQQPQPLPRQQQQSQPQPQQALPPWLAAEQAEAAAPGGGRTKRYRPVAKGDLLLPGGPAWSPLRRHIVAAGQQPGLPCLDAIILVEGDRDQEAVSRAVNAPVYVCDGTRVLKPHVAPELAMLRTLGRRLIVLTDPDERGRELRCHLETLAGPLDHAFVPEPAGTSSVDGPVHAAGNRGIEHVVPCGVQAALAAARPAWPKGRAVWSLERLQALRLANAFDSGAGGGHGSDGAAGRRRGVCAALGLGRCTAAQLVAALNTFFDEADVAAALAGLDDNEGEEVPGAGGA